MALQQPRWQRFAGGVAENYNRHLVPAIFAPWAEDLVDLAAPRPGERVLDVACGPGVVARLAARRAGTGQVTGLDINPGMLTVARSLPSELPISWQEGDALQLPFPDQAFHLVLCQQGAQFFPDRAAGLNEMRRVLVPGGRIALAVWGPIERSPGFSALAAALEHHVSGAAAAAARSPFSLPGTSELRDLMEGAGLRDVDVHSRTKMLRFPPPAEFVHQYVRGSPIAAAVGNADAAALEPAVREITEALQPYLNDHVLSFPIENHLATAVRPSRLLAPA
jgi:ubiquinone/menaquinone biosynthesis C-methylase UbiE